MTEHDVATRLAHLQLAVDCEAHNRKFLDRRIRRVLSEALWLMREHMISDDDKLVSDIKLCLSDLTGIEATEPCPRCEGSRVIQPRIYVPRIPADGMRPRLIECRRCDGVGFLTKDTEDRECRYCRETDPDDLQKVGGPGYAVWVCTDHCCRRDYDEEMRERCQDDDAEYRALYKIQDDA